MAVGRGEFPLPLSPPTRPRYPHGSTRRANKNLLYNFIVVKFEQRIKYLNANT